LHICTNTYFFWTMYFWPEL